MTPETTTAGLAMAQTMLALSLYTVVTSITPGPNNMMVLASGVNFGFRRTVPHILGISAGFAVMIVLMGTGLGAVFEVYPWLNSVLRWVGGGYLLYLAWKIARSNAPDAPDGAAGKPLGFVGAAALVLASTPSSVSELVTGAVLAVLVVVETRLAARAPSGVVAG